MSDNQDDIDFEYEDHDDFRNEIATVGRDGKRIWVYPKKPKGVFYTYRKYVSYVLLALLIGIPFIKIGGEPFVIFNVIESKFIILGSHFTLQDFHIFVIAMLIGMIFIALFTVLFGRLFCGWICPQTIFMEMVFRRIEYWIEGDHKAQKRLNSSSWNKDKIIKKAVKHTLFILVSIVVAHTFLSYIIGVDQLQKLVTEPISQHMGGFISMVVFTAVFYGVFTIMREQVCTTICPYGRMQSVLLDESSLAVSYDFVRGEPRGRLKKQKSSDFVELPIVQLGDCIDCTLCVQVCPTGIDIRHGTQLECVNCTACMDACDEVMVKIDKPKGLIRIDSYKGITEKTHKRWNGRVVAYSIVLVLLIGLESFMFYARSPVETLFLRTPGMMYQDQDDGYIRNLYNYQLINKTGDNKDLRFEVNDRPDIIFEPVGELLEAKANEVTEGAIFIKIPKDKLVKRKTDLKISVYEDDQLIDKTTTTFLGPVK